MTRKSKRPPADPDTQEQIELFEKFLQAVEAGRQVSFTQTKTCLKLKIHGLPDHSDYDRDDRIKLIRRTLVVLREGVGELVATKGSEHFEFWVESSVLRALPQHQWASEDGGLLNPAEFEHLEAEEFGLAPLNLVSLQA